MMYDEDVTPASNNNNIFDNDNDNSNSSNSLNNNNAIAIANGYKLLSPQGMATLQDFLKQHGNECIRQFVQVGCSATGHVTAKRSDADVVSTLNYSQVK